MRLCTRSTFSKQLASLLTESSEGRGYEALKNTAGPSLGWEDYQNIVRKEQEMTRRGEQLPPVSGDWKTWGYIPPKNYKTGEPFGVQDSRGRVVPWAPMEVIDAIRPLIRRIAYNYSRGSWDIPIFQFEDAEQMGMMGVLKALDADQGRTGPSAASFISFAKPHIQKVISQGFQEGGWEYRKARGLLDEVSTAIKKGATAQTAQAVQDIVRGRTISKTTKRPRPNLYAPQVKDGCAGHGLGDITKNEQGNCQRCGRPINNEYKHLAEPLQKFIDQIMTVINSGNLQELRAMQQKIEDYKNDLSEEEANFLPGAKTAGSTSGIRTSHAAAPVRATSIEKPTGGSESDENPRQNLRGNTQTPQEILMRREEPEALRRELRAVFDRVSLTPQEMRIIIRHYGLAEYPGKGTPSDTEVSGSGQSQWVMNGSPPMTANEISNELGIGVARVNQLKRRAMEKLQDAAGNMLENASTATELKILYEVRLLLVREIIAEVAQADYPRIILN